MDIRSYNELAREKEKKEVALKKLSGIGKKTVEALKEAGFDSLEKIRSQKMDELTKIKGIGKKTAQKILAEAKKAK